MLGPMAFFCPGGGLIGKSKKLNGESRHKTNGMEKKHSLSSNNLLTLSPTGSDLSRKESFQRMVVIQEYVPKDCTGVSVRRGQTVELIGGDREWLYVKTDRGEEGYVPRSHCVYPYSASRPEREGEMDSRPQLDNRSRSFSGMHGENNGELLHKMKEISSNGVAKARVLSPGFPSPYNKNSNNTNHTGEPTGVTLSAPHSPSTSIERNTSPNILVNGTVRFSDHSSSSGNYDASDSSADERTVSPEHSNTRSDVSGDGAFVSNALKNKMASESDLLAIKDRPLPATPATSKQPVHFYSIITDFPSSRKEAEVADNECPYSNPLDAIAPNQPSWGDKRWHGGSSTDIIRQPGSRQREGTPEWKPPLPSRAPLQGANESHCLSTGSNTGSQRSITASTDGSFCAEQQKENQNNKVYKFRKFIWGVYVIQQDFEAIDENEISVRTGQHVSLLNQDDAEWYWVVRHDDSQEGFVPRSHLQELMHVEQPYSAVTGKPLVNGLKQYSNECRSYRSGSDGGRATPTSSVTSDSKSGPRFARSHSGSPSCRVMPPSNNRNRQRNQVNGLSTSPAPAQHSEKDASSSSHRLKVTEGAQMRKSESVPAPRRDTVKSPEVHNSSAQSESGESSIVGTLV